MLKPHAFGLDIGDRSLKVAALRRRGDRFTLESVGRLDLEPGIVQRGRIVNEAILAERIRLAMAQATGKPIRDPFVVASLPEEESFIRVVQTPPGSTADFAAAVQVESESNIPVYLNEVYLDWQLINESAATEQRHTDVLIAAVRREVVDAYLACLGRAGLKPVALEVESFGIARALMAARADAPPTLIIDLGSTKTSFIVFSRQSVRFTVTIPFESDNLTEAIGQALGVPLPEAERLKAAYGLDTAQADGRVARAMQPKLKFLIQQIQKYIDFYNSHPVHEHSTRRTIERAVLSGGGAELPGLDQYLSTALKLPVAIGNPWVNILSTPLQTLVAATYRQSTYYTTALGLALRGTEPYAR